MEIELINLNNNYSSFNFIKIFKLIYPFAKFKFVRG